MSPVTTIFAREKNHCLGNGSFPLSVDSFLGLWNRTKYQYDNAGQLLKTIAPDPDGNTSTTSDIPVSQIIYNADGETTAAIAPYGQPSNTTQYLYRTVMGNEYDYLGRQVDTKKGVMIDDQDAGFLTPIGTWATNSGGGYENQYRSVAGAGSGGSTSATATWTFNNLIAGRQYELIVSYMADSSNTANAIYSVTNGALVGNLQTIDQQITPTHSILGSGWQTRGIYQINTGYTSLTVTLSNGNTIGNVIADAACLIEVTPAASSTYNANGNVVTSTDSKLRVTTNEYDSLGRLVKVTSPDADPSNGSSTDIPVAKYVYDAAGQMIESHQGASSGTTDLVTAYQYDYLGRRIAVIFPDELEGYIGTRKNTYSYDLLGNLLYQYDALGNQTGYIYDAFGRLTDKYDPDPNSGLVNTALNGSPHTVYTYDADGEQLSLTDPNSNTTYWTYDYLGRKVEEKVYESTMPYSTIFTYNITGDLKKKVDPEGRETDYNYDYLHRQTSEVWMSSATPSTPIRTMSYAYDTFGRMLSVTDYSGSGGSGSTPLSANYTYSYDWYGNNTASSQTIAGLTPVVNLTQQFDVAGNRLQLNAKLDSTQCFQNQYKYDALNRMTEVSQGSSSGGGQSSMSLMSQLSLLDDQAVVGQGVDDQGVIDDYLIDDGVNLDSALLFASAGGSGGIYAANKLVDFTYDAYGRLQIIYRYNDFSKTKTVAKSFHGYDPASPIRGINNTLGYSGGWASTYTSYSWDYDDANRVTSFTSPDGNGGAAITTNYTYDHDSQLKTADQSNESYSYDANGNRIEGSYQAGTQNRLTYDGTYYYTYDHEGNRQFRFKSSSGSLDSSATDITQYVWDYRNRLTTVNHFTTYATYYPTPNPDKAVSYTYDAFDRKLSMSQSGSAVPVDRRAYVYDGQNMILEFHPTTTGSIPSSALSHFYLHGPAVDQILADDYGSTTSGGNSGSVRWMLADNEGTIRDTVVRTSSGTMASVVNHLKYDAFGNITAQSNANEQPHFTYTGRELDAATGLYYYRARWYDAKTGKFISQDPMSFQAGDENLYRYVGNNPTNATDPTGMWKLDPDHPWMRLSYYLKEKEEFIGCIIAEPGDTFERALYLMTGSDVPDPSLTWPKKPKAGASYPIGPLLERFNKNLRNHVVAAASKFSADFKNNGDLANLPPDTGLSFRQYIDYFFHSQTPTPRVACAIASNLVETEGLLDALPDGDEKLLGLPKRNYSNALWDAYSMPIIGEPQREGEAGAFVNSNAAVAGSIWATENVVVLKPQSSFFANTTEKKIWSSSDLVAFLLRKASGRGPVSWSEPVHMFWDVIKIEHTLFDKRNQRLST